MMTKKSMLVALAILIPIMLYSGPAFSVPPIVDYGSVAKQDSCEALKSYVEGLTDVTFNKPITNVTATWRTTSAGATFCQVTGWIWPETKFQVTMPTLWNERYQMNGGGGWDGGLSVPNSPNAQGYATSSANGGYMSANWPGTATFALKEPYFNLYYGDAGYPKGGAGNYYGPTDPKGTGNPYACQKVADYGYRHLYETPVIAKKIVKHYYGIDPKKSYYSGGSNGGKEGQITAQKFPQLFDGYYIGCPLGGMVAVTFRGTWDTLWGATLASQADPNCVPVRCTPSSPPGCVPVTCPSVYSYKQALHYKSVYDKCDAIDGLKDGLIDDPRKCKFDAMTDLPACDATEEAAENAGDFSSPKAYQCFTFQQRQALAEIYAGPHDSKGNAWYPGQPLSAEYLAAGFGGGVSSGFGSAISDGMAPPMFANIALDPPDGPNFDITKFNWDTDPIAMQETTCQTYNIHNTLDGITINPQPAPNMGGFEAVYKKGAKIIQHHGWADSLVTALAASVGLYETALETMGVEKTKSFWKLYVVPGAGHCGGGIATAYPTAGFDAMVDWVENGIEPTGLTGSRRANVDPNYPDARTGLSCPYPEVARWNGSSDNGGINNASNYSCVPPIEVRMEPETLNLKSKGEFTAFITLPEGYNIRDWNISNLTCEGASAVKGMISGNSYVAKFKTQDLQDVETGGEVTLTVKGKFNHGGIPALIQAGDTVRVIK